MSNPIPTNDLDRAISALQKSTAAMPEFYRQLSKGQLWFLVRYHPEIEGEVLELKNGSPLPFSMIEDKKGPVVPLFSSVERLEEGLKRGRVPPRTYSAGDMPALQVLEILGKAGLRAVINKSCTTGEITIPPDLMRDLADGSALKPQPIERNKEMRGKLTIIDPANYPTNLIQPVFECLKRHKNYRAAWIFLRPEVPGQPRVYQLLFLMDPRDDVISHDMNMTIQATRGQTKDKVEIGLIDERDTAYIARIFQQVPAFYVAADYKVPGA